ncbi:MAG: glycosyltransferase [Alphaproteobacteria bacterium]
MIEEIAAAVEDLPVLFSLSFALLAAWGALLAFRGDFWRADQRLEEGSLEPETFPAVTAVVPARNEADVIGAALSSLQAQDYQGDFHICVVDDGSEDGTADAVRRAGIEDLLTGRDRPDGWTGKMWAVSQGVDHAREKWLGDRYIWLTDADIAHHPGELSTLIAQSENRNLDLNSAMVRLRMESFWDRLLIPAFVFFFQKLYPFPWVNDPDRSTAAAAGGSMLVNAGALKRIGGIGTIAGELIDDCALAAAIKRSGGAIRLALATETRSLRAYETVWDIWSMVARTAFHQLKYSALYLVGTVLGMAVLYLGPPVLTAVAAAQGEWPAAAGAFAAWFAMSWAYAPTLYRYGLNPWYGFALPVSALLYVLMTVDSARRHWAGRGGEWKGRAHRT